MGKLEIPIITVLTPNGANGWYTKNVEIRMEDSESYENSRVTQIRYQIGDANGTNWGAEQVINLTASIRSGVHTISTDGIYTIRARAYDGMGYSGYTQTYTIKRDVTPPAKPGLPNLIDAHDTGKSNTDNITNKTTVTIDGYAEAGATIHLRKAQRGSEVIETAVANASGYWAINTDLVQNVCNNIQVWAGDAAGNWSVASDILEVFSDTIAPTVPTITYNGGSNTCTWKNNYNLTLTSTDGKFWSVSLGPSDQDATDCYYRFTWIIDAGNGNMANISDPSGEQWLAEFRNFLFGEKVQPGKFSWTGYCLAPSANSISWVSDGSIPGTVGYGIDHIGVCSTYFVAPWDSGRQVRLVAKCKELDKGYSLGFGPETTSFRVYNAMDASIEFANYVPVIERKF